MTTPAKDKVYAHRMLWKCGGSTLVCGVRPLIMAVLNVTPDSFSDGNQYFDTSKAVSRGVEMLEQGADILDIGGESTRPGADPVSEQDEIARVVPVIRELAAKIAADGRDNVLLSVDTMKAAVAAEAVAAGASIINDVSAFTHDPKMAETAAASEAGIVLMHMQGTPRVMQKDPTYEEVVTDIRDYLQARITDLEERGIERSRLAIDPGIGFGKTLEHNLMLLGRLEEFRACGCPIVVGLSRKSMLGAITGREVTDRLSASIAGLTFSIARGAHIMRVHDIRESVDAAKVAAAIESHGAAGVWPRADA